jgi:hypothetical protein
MFHLATPCMNELELVGLMIRAYDKVHEFLEEHFNQPNLGEYVYHIIEGSKETSGNFVYACEVIQWVENNLEEWLGEE